jgi:hypothetical protein
MRYVHTQVTYAFTAHRAVNGTVNSLVFVRVSASVVLINVHKVQYVRIITKENLKNRLVRFVRATMYDAVCAAPVCDAVALVM